MYLLKSFSISDQYAIKKVLMRKITRSACCSLVIETFPIFTLLLCDLMVLLRLTFGPTVGFFKMKKMCAKVILNMIKVEIKKEEMIISIIHLDFVEVKVGMELLLSSCTSVTL